MDLIGTCCAAKVKKKSVEAWERKKSCKNSDLSADLLKTKQPEVLVTAKYSAFTLFIDDKVDREGCTDLFSYDCNASNLNLFEPIPYQKGKSLEFNEARQAAAKCSTYIRQEYGSNPVPRVLWENSVSACDQSTSNAHASLQASDIPCLGLPEGWRHVLAPDCVESAQSNPSSQIHDVNLSRKSLHEGIDSRQGVRGPHAPIPQVHPGLTRPGPVRL
jgi:hypothetical protein